MDCKSQIFLRRCHCAAMMPSRSRLKDSHECKEHAVLGQQARGSCSSKVAVVRPLSSPCVVKTLYLIIPYDSNIVLEHQKEFLRRLQFSRACAARGLFGTAGHLSDSWADPKNRSTLGSIIYTIGILESMIAGGPTFWILPEVWAWSRPLKARPEPGCARLESRRLPDNPKGSW